MRRSILVTGLAALVLSLTQPAGAIVYGEPTGPGRYTNVGSMVVEWEGELIEGCTGTLIAEGVFLTASHCLVLGFPIEDIYLSFAHDLDGPSDDEIVDPTLLIQVDEVVVHPGFGHDQANPFDVGVILFDDDTGLEPAAIADVGYWDGLEPRSQRFTAVGYGGVRSTNRGGPAGITYNLERRYAEQGFLSMQKAWLTLSMNLSTGSGGTCYGDSGGPHFHGDTIVSITVTGDAVCKASDKTYRLDTPWVHEFLEPWI